MACLVENKNSIKTLNQHTLYNTPEERLYFVFEGNKARNLLDWDKEEMEEEWKGIPEKANEQHIIIFQLNLSGICSSMAREMKKWK